MNILTTSQKRAPTAQARPSTLATVTPVVYLPEPLREAQAYACPICKDRGWLRVDVPVGHPQFGKPIQCTCQKQEMIEQAQARTYTWLGQDRQEAMELEQKTFEMFTRREAFWQQFAYDQASGYASMVRAQSVGQPNMLFKGNVGTGNTHLACAILNLVRAAGIPCLFATAPELFTVMYAAEFARKDTIIMQAATTPLLVLDDIDKLHIRLERSPTTKPGSYQKSVLFDVLNHRYRVHRPTILTTNEQSGLDRWLDEATQDRLLGNALTIEMLGRSQRRGG